MRLVLFDCDGTLADSFGLICETMRRTFLAHGFELPADAKIHAIIGLSLDQAILALRPDVDPTVIPVLVEAYRTSFRAVREEAAFRETLFPGMRELLLGLAIRSDVTLGMVTGKTRRGVDAVVAAHDLEAVFAVVRTADDCASKPHPGMVLESCAERAVPPARTIVVGDAVFDMAMAKAAGAAGLGVSWGAGTARDLLTAGAAAVAVDVEDLGRKIDDWIAGDLEDPLGRSKELVP